MTEPPEPFPALSDRGPAKYFHGRTSALRHFANWCSQAVVQKSGTIFLVQGAPGVGKTALLAKCEEMAVHTKWLVANIETDALYDIDALRAHLGTRLRWLAGLEGLSISGFRAAWRNTRHIWEILRRTARAQDGGGLLLILDEAQHLGNLAAEHAGQARPILNQIHDGKLDAPVMLLAGGLGTSVRAFGKLGVSRFAKRCLVELGPLSAEAERAVLRDWLTKDGQAKGDVTPWIDAITKETCGWPQHIMSYVDPALAQLHNDAGAVSAVGLDAVLVQGRADRMAYYKGRIDEFETSQLCALTEALITGTPADGVPGNDICQMLARHYGADKAGILFELALQKGVIARHGDGYAAPIPSMHDWLVSKYSG